MALDEDPAVVASTVPSATAEKRRRKAARTCKARSLACRECRDRKIRCDGARPVCDACSRRGWGAEQCVYPEIEHEGSIASSRSYILALQKRVKELEEKEQQMANALHHHVRTSGTPPAYDDTLSRPLHSPRSAPPQPILPPINTELKYQIPGFPMVHDLPTTPYTASHHHSALQMGASPPLTDDLEDSAPLQSSFGSYSTNAQAAALLEKISLPPTHAMDELLGAYFDHDWITLPIVHRPSFLHRYQHLVAVSNSRYRRDIPLAEATDLAVTYTLLLGMLALGQLSRSPSDAPGAMELHQQARGLLLADLSLVPSPLVVQALVLHARFLRRSRALQESWLLMGVAQRLAEGLMLNVNVSGKTQLELEERRRTWCACVQLLRSQGPTPGSPGSSSASFGILPQEIDDEFLEGRLVATAGSQPAHVPSIVSFFVQSLRLSETVLEPAKSSFTASSDDKCDDVFTMLGKTMAFEDKLQQWHGELPRHIVYGDAASHSSALYRRQATLMHIKYLEAKSLIYRLAILQVVDRASKKALSGLSKCMVDGIVQGCWAAGMDLVDLVAQDGDAIMQSGVVPCHMAMVLGTICSSMSLIVTHPQLTSLSTDRALLDRDSQRCKALVNQLGLHNDASISRALQTVDDVLHDRRPRATLSPLSDIVDPSLEPDAPGLPPCSELAMAEQAGRPYKDGAMKMTFLEAW